MRKPKPLETISYLRALLIATIPPLGVWKQVRENPAANDRLFSRRPTRIEDIESVLGAGALVGSFLAGIVVLQILAGFVAVVWLVRPLGRLLIPRRLARSERELVALTWLIRPTPLVLFGLPIWLAAEGEWLAAAILGCFSTVAALLAMFLAPPHVQLPSGSKGEPCEQLSAPVNGR